MCLIFKYASNTLNDNKMRKYSAVLQTFYSRPFGMKWDLNRVLINEISKSSIPFSAAGPNQAANLQRRST